MTKPLEGVRVLDLSRFPPGAYCTILLADLGADVIRVEAPGSNPMMGGVGVGLSRGKRSIAIDLRHERGHDVLRRVAGSVDVLVENHRPGDLEQRGFGYRHAAEEMPRLIWCSITGFGQDGPYARWPGHDLTYTAHSGLLGAINPELPWHPQQILASPLGSMMAALGVVSALHERTTTGKGSHLDISLAEASTWLLSGADGEINGNPFGIPITPDRHLYRCSDDRWVTTAAAEPRTWTALCEGLGLEDLIDTRPGSPEREGAGDRIAAVFATRPAKEWVAELGPKGAAIGMVNHGPDLPDDPQVAARASLVDVDGTLVPTNPIRRREVDGPVPQDHPGPSPAVGGDTRSVLAEAGCTEAEIQEMHDSGVIAAQ